MQSRQMIKASQHYMYGRTHLIALYTVNKTLI